MPGIVWMGNGALLRSGAVRFAILIASIFATGSVILLVQVEQSVGRYATEVASDSVASEIALLRNEDQSAGHAQLIDSIGRREQAVREHQLRYVLINRLGRRLAGSIPPTFAHLGSYDLELPPIAGGDEGDGANSSLRAFGVRLADGAILVVASDTSELRDLRHALATSTALFGAGLSLLALIGGLVVGTVFLRRLGRVNQVVGQIMHGHLSERLPAIGMSPEFDALSANLNLMLDRIERLMRGLSQVSNDIAHDLRTPLTRLQQRLEQMKAGLSASSPVTEDQIDAAVGQTDSILAIFRALLRISSLEAGAGKRRFVEFSLSELAERVFQAYSPVAEDAEHVLSARIDPSVKAYGDPELITQAITNLIENALAHTPSGSHIGLFVEQTSTGAVVEVTDDGPGVPEGERERVLRRFYRLDASRHSIGAGLGLALVSAIVELHTAKLELSDNHPGLRAKMSFPNA